MEKHRILNESATFLIEHVEDKISADIKSTILLLNRRWDDVMKQVKDVVVKGRTDKARQQYGTGLDDLKVWIATSESTVNNGTQCSAQHIKEHIEAMEVYILPLV